MEINFTIFL